MDVDAAWSALRRRMTASARPRPALRWVVPIAATIVIALGVTLLAGRPHGEPVLEARTAAGERRTVRLSDGSSISLAPGSRVRYPARFRDRRQVTLTGQAWFEVQPESHSPFVVAAGGHQVRVLGTSFGVRVDSTGDSVTVVVGSGRVGFSRAGSTADPLELAAGEGAVAAAAADPRRLAPADADGAGSWLRGTLRFHRAPLAGVIGELERWFALQVQVDDPAMAGRPVTGEIGLDSPERALETVALALDLELVRRGSVVRFVPRGAGR